MIKGSNLVCSFPFHFPNQNPGKMNCLAEFLFSFYSNYLAKPRQQSDGVICKREQINGEEMARPAGFEPVATT